MRAMSGPEDRKRSFWSVLVVVVFAGTMAAAVLGVRHAHRAEGRATAKAKGKDGAGCAPAAVSSESMTASVPSRTALATSDTSARVGRRCSTMLSSICVAVMTNLPRALHFRMSCF